MKNFAWLAAIVLVSLSAFIFISDVAFSAIPPGGCVVGIDVSGTLRDQDFNTPITNAEIYLNSRTAGCFLRNVTQQSSPYNPYTTDSNGYFRTTNLALDDHNNVTVSSTCDIEVVMTKPGYVNKTANISVDLSTAATCLGSSTMEYQLGGSTTQLLNTLKVFVKEFSTNSIVTMGKIIDSFNNVERNLDSAGSVILPVGNSNVNIRYFDTRIPVYYNNKTENFTLDLTKQNLISLFVKKHANITTNVAFLNNVGFNRAVYNTGETLVLAAIITNGDISTAAAKNVNATVSFNPIGCGSVPSATQNLITNLDGNQGRTILWNVTMTGNETCTATVIPSGTDVDSDTPAYVTLDDTYLSYYTSLEFNNPPVVNDTIVSPYSGNTSTDFKISATGYDIEDTNDALTATVGIKLDNISPWVNYTANYNPTTSKFEFIFNPDYSTTDGTYETLISIRDTDRGESAGMPVYFSIQEPPVIWSFETSNSTPWPGDTVTFSFNITDNSGSLAISNFDNSPMIHNSTSDLWYYDYNVPTLDNIYNYDIYAEDPSGNNATEKLYVKVNSSDNTTPVKFDLKDPIVGSITPKEAYVGSTQFSADAWDDTGIESCVIYLNSNATATDVVQLGNGSARAQSLLNLNEGNYQLYASCNDSFGRMGTGPLTDVTVNIRASPGTPSGGSGGGYAYVVKELNKRLEILAPETLVANPGTSVSFPLIIRNDGDLPISGVSVEIIGVPESWLDYLNDLNDLTFNESKSQLVTVNVPIDAQSETRTLILEATSVENVHVSKTIELQISGTPATTGNQTTTGGIASGITGALVAITKVSGVTLIIMITIATIAYWYFNIRKKPKAIPKMAD